MGPGRGMAFSFRRAVDLNALASCVLLPGLDLRELGLVGGEHLGAVGRVLRPSVVERLELLLPGGGLLRRQLDDRSLVAARDGGVLVGLALAVPPRPEGAALRFARM